MRPRHGRARWLRVGRDRHGNQIHDTSARLNGVVRNTNAEATEYWFEYGPTRVRRDPASRTPSVVTRDIDFANPSELAGTHAIPLPPLCKGVDGARTAAPTCCSRRRRTALGDRHRHRLHHPGARIRDRRGGQRFEWAGRRAGERRVPRARPLFPPVRSGPVDVHARRRKPPQWALCSTRLSRPRGNVPQVLFIEDNGPSGDRIQFSNARRRHTVS
jgi:hypothetical protein